MLDKATLTKIVEYVGILAHRKGQEDQIRGASKPPETLEQFLSRLADDVEKLL